MCFTVCGEYREKSIQILFIKEAWKNVWVNYNLSHRGKMDVTNNALSCFYVPRSVLNVFICILSCYTIRKHSKNLNQFTWQCWLGRAKPAPSIASVSYTLISLWHPTLALFFSMLLTGFILYFSTYWTHSIKI